VNRNAFNRAAVSGLSLILVSSVAIALEEATFKQTLSLDTPEVLKLDWGARSLEVNDLDKDGLSDLVVVDNDLNRIQFFYQLEADKADTETGKISISEDRWNPTLQDAPYREENLTIGFPIFDLAVGDLNGDGLADLAYTSGVVPLSIRFKEASGIWGEPVEYASLDALGWTGTVSIVDLEGSGRLDLVVLAKEGFHVLRGSEGTIQKGRLDTFNLTGENPFNLLLEDVNRDGLLDVIYITSSTKQSVTIRFHLDSGGFGPEVRFPMDRSVRMIAALPTRTDEAPTFCSVDSRSGGLEFFKFEESSRTGALIDDGVFAQIMPLFGERRDDSRYSYGDFNEDGFTDIIISVSGAPELYWFQGSIRGFAEAKRFPTLTEVSALEQGYFSIQKKPQLVVLSAEESVVGLSSMDTTGRITFPDTLKLYDGKPVVSKVVDWDYDGLDELALVYEKDSIYTLVLAAPSDRLNLKSTWEVLHEYSLGKLRRAPYVMDAYRLDSEKNLHLMLFLQRESPVFIKLDSNGSTPISECFVESSIRQSFLKEVLWSRISAADLNNDGVSELMVGKRGYARAIKVVAGALVMVDQFNARDSSDDVHTVLTEFGDSNGSDLVGLYIQAAGELHLLRKDTDGVYRFENAQDLGQISLVAPPKTIEIAGEPIAIMPGSDRFWMLDFGATRWKKQSVGQYETELEDVRYSSVSMGDLDGDGSTELVAIDGQNNIIEVVGMTDDGWKRLLYWKVFEKNMHYRGRDGAKVEPRETQIANLNSNEMSNSLFLLIHDRLLVYPTR